jgi:hypothetical protein
MLLSYGVVLPWQNWVFAALPVLIGVMLLDKPSSFPCSGILIQAVTHRQRAASPLRAREREPGWERSGSRV